MEHPKYSLKQVKVSRIYNDRDGQESPADPDEEAKIVLLMKIVEEGWRNKNISQISPDTQLSIINHLLKYGLLVKPDSYSFEQAEKEWKHHHNE